MNPTIWRAGIILFVVVASLNAQDATWGTNPGSGDWNTPSNWAPSIVPTGMATFATSNATNVSISANTGIGSIVFNSGANAFTINVLPPGGGGLSTFTISGVGIVNNSGIAQNFVTTSTGGGVNVGRLFFANSATAGNASFTNS